MAKPGRLEREARTLQAMLHLYCRGQHGAKKGLCPACGQLQAYALQRLEKCPYQAGKTTCARCPIHCYQPEMRAVIRAAMRYAGPRMLLAHPIMAIQHALASLRKEPGWPH